MADLNTNDNENKKESPPTLKPPIFQILVIISIAILFLYLLKDVILTPGNFMSYARFKEELKKGNIETINLRGDKLWGNCSVLANCKTYQTLIPEPFLRDSRELSELRNTFISVKGEGAADNFKYYSQSNFLYTILLPTLPWLALFIIIWLYLSHQLRSQGSFGSILQFNKSRAKLVPKGQKKITFNDVAGIDEAKQEVKEVVEFLQSPEKFRKMGARIPRGILLVGPPGVGKTLLAKAVAGEADAPFYSISGSDFVELFVGVGAARVRSLFAEAKKHKSAIVFLDEIDAVGRTRGSGLGGGHDEREQTLNQILVEMDGFDTQDNTIVFAATNRPDVLDPALLRPGRFDKHIVLDLPDVKGRLEILKVHAKKIKLAPQVNLEVIAKTTPGFSGADLESLINEAALSAVIKKKEAVELEDLEEARDKVKWGRQRTSKIMDEEEKKITAYHESGHALISKLLPNADPAYKVSIIPRGVALGATMPLPTKDRYHLQKNYLLTTITVLLAGRVAEEVFLSDISAGAKDDIKKATELARTMVCEWGMSDKLGPINYSESEEHIFLGREITRSKPHSEETFQKIDLEVREIIKRCYDRAKELILENKEVCDEIAKLLLQKEVISGQEIDEIIAKYRSKGRQIEKSNISPVDKNTASHPY